MTKTASKIRFRAKLLRPAETPTRSRGSWTFLTLPTNASAKLPSRGMTTVEGTINGSPFRATLEPDGQKSHWLKVDRKLSEAAGAEAGDVVTLEIAPLLKRRLSGISVYRQPMGRLGQAVRPPERDDAADAKRAFDRTPTDRRKKQGSSSTSLGVSAHLPWIEDQSSYLRCQPRFLKHITMESASSLMSLSSCLPTLGSW